MRDSQVVEGTRRVAQSPVSAVCDFPEGLVGVDGSSQWGCGTARCRRACPRQSLTETESPREIEEAKKRPSAPAHQRGVNCLAGWVVTVDERGEDTTLRPSTWLLNDPPSVNRGSTSNQILPDCAYGPRSYCCPYKPRVMNSGV